MLRKMKNVLIFVMLLLLIVLFFVRCEDNITNYYMNSETNARVIGSIHGVVCDANTNLRLKDVLVTWGVDGEIKTAKTNSLGYYSITDLPPGDYEISFSYDSNATGRVTVTIPSLQQIGITNMPTKDDFYYSTVQDMNLYKLNSSLIGVVYAKQDDENSKLARGVIVIADFANYDLSPAEYTAITDSIGTFNFKNLPSTSSAILRTMPYNDGIYNYSVKTINASLIPNGTANSGNIVLEIAPKTPIIVQNNFENDDFVLTDNIVVTFSKTMIPSSFNITLYSLQYGNVEFEEVWSNDITLTIDPYVALQANETYYLSLNGLAQDNSSFSENFDFMTQTGIEFIRTNLERVDGVFDEFPVESNIELTFSMEIDLDNYNGYVIVRDESNASVSITKSLSSDSKTIMIDPRNNLEPGENYSLSYKIYSNIDGDYEEDQIYFKTESDLSTPDAVSGFSLDMGNDWSPDWNTTTIDFKWNTVNNATTYKIYAKDNKNNTDLINVGSFEAQDYAISQKGTINLNAFPQFDYYESDYVQTPLTNGTELTFYIVACNGNRESALSDALIIKDNTVPTGSLSQNGSANNSSGSDILTFTINFSASEYLKEESFSFGFTENGGDNNYVLTESSVSFKWNANLKGGVFTITVPDSSNGSGDLFHIGNFKDNSGNISNTSVSIQLF